MAGEMSPPVVVRSGGAPGTLLFPPSYTGPFSPVAVAKVEGQEYACKCRPGSEHAFILCPGFARTQSGALHPSFAHLTSHHPASSPPISILAVPLLQQGGGGGGGNGMKTRPSAATVRPVVVLMTDGRRRGRELNPIERLQVIQAVQHLPVCEGFEYDCGMEIVRVAEVRNAKSACIVIDASVTVTVKTIGKGEWDDGREGSCGGGVEGYEQMAVATTSTADRHTAKSRLGGVDHLLSLFVDAFKLMEMGGLGPRGFLLRGPPGTGKTALVREVASQLRTNVVIIEGAVIAGMQAGLAEAMLKRKLDDTKV
uniref:ATPase AAA-type core domain-containing protein n=1 Tax=Palpitomonas bilix TaxID=652834 RepID=A0A7S3CWM4_9EUKA